MLDLLALCRALLTVATLLPLQLYAVSPAIVDAYMIFDGRAAYRAYFQLVQWDRDFNVSNPATMPGSIRTTMSRLDWAADGSEPFSSSESGILDDKYAKSKIENMLNTWIYSPYWQSLPELDPQLFQIYMSGSNGGSYSILVRVRKWTGPTLPTRCSLTAGPIVITPAENTKVVSAQTTVAIYCTVKTSYKLTIGTAGGDALVPYTAGGQVRMSFSGGTTQQPNIYLGHSEKNETTQTTAWATTVPGTALPGTYSASAILKVEIL